jgi:shikimate 5-dehydrogenase
VKAVALEHIAAHSFTAIVNCTSAGMTGSGAESIDPLPAAFEIQTGMIVMDTVYRPRETPLLKRARAAGAVIVDGTEMFLRQAALQFEFFTKEHIVSETATGNVPQQNAASTHSHITASPNNSQIKVQNPSAPIELWRKLLDHKLDARS